MDPVKIPITMTYFRLKAGSTLCLMALLADHEAAFMPRLLALAASKPNALAIAWYDLSFARARTAFSCALAKSPDTYTISVLLSCLIFHLYF